MNPIERHIRCLVDSDFALVRPKENSDVAKASIGHATPQKLAIEEANQVLTFLDRQPKSTQQPGSMVPSPPRPTPSPPHTPPDDQALAKAYPHHIRYLGTACRAPPQKALFYLEQAVEAGSRLAGAEAGFMYVHGVGGAPNLARGLQLLDEACAVGHPGAMLAVGRCLKDGTGVPRDAATGLVWMERAAALRYAPAAHELGEMYETGDFGGAETSRPQSSESGDASQDSAGAPGRDLVTALRYYKVAAELDFAPSQLNIAKLFLLGSSLGLNASPGETDVRARYWLERAASNGSMEARTLLQRAKHEDPEEDVDRGGRAAKAAGGRRAS